MGSTLPLLEIVAFRFSRPVRTTATRATGWRPLSFTSAATSKRAASKPIQIRLLKTQSIPAPGVPDAFAGRPSVSRLPSRARRAPGAAQNHSILAESQSDCLFLWLSRRARPLSTLRDAILAREDAEA